MILHADPHGHCRNSKNRPAGTRCPSTTVHRRVVGCGKPLKSQTKPSARLRARLLTANLLVTATGGKFWRFKYRFEGREKLLSFSSFPDVPLRVARGKRERGSGLARIYDFGRERSHARRTAESMQQPSLVGA